MVDAELVRRAKELLDQLCEQPRFAGSAEEARTRALCKRELQNAGFECAERPFEYSEWPARCGAPLSSALQAATIIIVARMAMERGPLSAILAGGALVAAMFFIDAYAKRRGITNFPRQRARSVNLEAKRGVPRVWLVAHLDSKSQTVPMLVRIAGSVALMGVMASTLVVLLLALVGSESANRLWSAVQLAAALAAVPGVCCFVRNGSTGGVDNASGVVATILASRSPTAPRDLGILITSAEELGLAGARVWAGSASADFRILNCDTIDDAGGWHCMYSGANPQVITGIAPSAAAPLGLRLRLGRLIPGILADNIAFADRGIPAVTISRGNLQTLARIHTRRDTSNALTGRGVAEASLLLGAIAKELA